ncbi:Homeobox protein PKNOX2 [Trichoplax sp. H2]|nr:Homeobox protein PKNOX2 [Trichoplax sp. H2]|eukprot:RDD46089.1 Homeobox protein PKNOX2 [Trichoplax sp. H2]
MDSSLNPRAGPVPHHVMAATYGMHPHHMPPMSMMNPNDFVPHYTSSLPPDKIPPPPYEDIHSHMPTATPQNTNSQADIGVFPNGSFQTEKRAIYHHPLFPLLVMLYEKCERATWGNESPSSSSFDAAIEDFLRRQSQERKNCVTENEEVNSMMIKAIQVLRIHLLELEKVNELCKDFCQRYIGCLKNKMNSDNLLREQNTFNGSCSANQGQHEIGQINEQHSMFSNIAESSLAIPTSNTLPASGNMQIVVSSYDSNATSCSAVDSYPNIGNLSNNNYVECSNQSQTQARLLLESAAQDSAGGETSITPEHMKSKDHRMKRGILPKQATTVMKTWLFQHLMHPYPTEDEKRAIATQTNLSILQVNNWFINARRRILQPMLDSSNPGSNKSKKPKQQSRPPQKFWSETYANQPQSHVAQKPPTHFSSSVIKQ